jgi:hypothetical protein
MDTERHSITRPDGRDIDFLVVGPADGLPLVLHEALPSGWSCTRRPCRPPGYAGCGSSWLAGLA